MAVVAEAYAVRCIFSINENRVDGTSFMTVGENRAKTSDLTASYESIIEQWANQSVHYNVSTGSCRQNCSEYIQV